jgi:uncharacterized damage-inducible protein DinB
MADGSCTLADHYRMFGRYNGWANGRLFAAACRLSADQYRADRGTFFKSVHGTLNHLLVTDRSGCGASPAKAMRRDIR